MAGCGLMCLHIRVRADVPSYKGRQLKLSFSDGGKSWDKTTYWTTASTVSVKDGKVFANAPSCTPVVNAVVYYSTGQSWGGYYVNYRSGSVSGKARMVHSSEGWVRAEVPMVKGEKLKLSFSDAG